ncbi:MAG: hypothetical protein NVS9B13_10820 [Candidatus Acidiferrum sp.]
MMKVYYKSMPSVVTAIAFFFWSATASNPLLGGQQPSTVKAAALESHEGLTISARPWSNADLYKDKFGKNSPFKVGLVAIQVSFRNDTNQAIKVNLDKIQLLLRLSEEDRQNLDSLTPEDVADAVRNPGARDITATRKRIPAKTRGWRDKHWDEILQAAQDAGLPSRLIAPHSTMQGLVFFDLRGQLDLLDSAHVYIPDLITLETNHPLFYFEIDLGRHASN